MKPLAILLFPAFAIAAELPPPANHPVDFAKDIQPLFEAACVKCHAKGKDSGGFSLETRESFLKGGDTGPAIELGNSAKSLAVGLVAGLDPDNVMPQKGKRWTAEQVGLLRKWIDQGAMWPDGFTFRKARAAESRAAQSGAAGRRWKSGGPFAGRVSRGKWREARAAGGGCGVRAPRVSRHDRPAADSGTARGI